MVVNVELLNRDIRFKRVLRRTGCGTLEVVVNVFELVVRSIWTLSSTNPSGISLVVVSDLHQDLCCGVVRIRGILSTGWLAIFGSFVENFCAGLLTAVVDFGLGCSLSLRLIVDESSVACYWRRVFVQRSALASAYSLCVFSGLIEESCIYAVWQAPFELV